MTRTRAAATIALSLILTLVLSLSSATATSPPREDDPLPPLEVALNTLTPIVPKARGKLTLTGTVTNTTESDLDSVSVSVRLGESPITSRTELDEVSTGAFNPFTRGVIDGTAEIPAVAAGTTVPWRLSVRIAELQLGATGVYYLRVDAIADFDNTISASTRTFLPWFPDPDLVIPTEVSWLWPISDWPNRDATNVFLTDRTPTELATDGRLRQLLDLGLSAGRKIDWVIDPQVLESASVISGGYQVMGINNNPVDGGSPEPATTWLTQARAGLADASVYAWAYANPDVTALSQADMGGEVIAATTIAPEQLETQLGRTPTASLGWPIGRRTDRESLGVLQRAGVRTVIMDPAGLQPPTDSGTEPGPTALIQTDAGPLQAVVIDSVLSDSLGSADDSAASALIDRQRFLAETGVLATTPGTTGVPVVVGPESQWNPNPTTVSGILTALTDAPWVTTTPLAAVIADGSTDTSRSLAPVATGTKRSLRRAEHLQKVANTQKEVRLFGSIMENQGALTEPYAAALLRTTSGAWRSQAREGDQLLSIINTQLNADIDKVRVISGGVINISSAAGAIPITISNDLDVPVRVGLKLSGTPAVRLVASDATPIVIPANRKVSTEIDAQVIGNGELTVEVQLTNSAGRDYGKPAEVILRSTAYAQAASCVVGIAFLLLTGLLAMNSIRRRRQARADKAKSRAAGPNSDDAGPADAAGQPDQDRNQ
ncbi:MAG: hypothetical protein HQ526_06370 [Actinobacteria bacterium]|nr:hypothetical protein [Actinomycetota bacterium]